MQDTTRPKSRGWPIALLFSVGAALAILLTVGSVLAVSITGSRANLVRQLGDRFDLKMQALEARIADHLRPAEYQLGYLSQWIAKRADLTVDSDRLVDIVRGAMAAAPQVLSIAWVEADGRSVRLERDDRVTRIDDLQDRADIAAIVRGAKALGRDGPALGWSGPLYSPNIGQPIIVFRTSVWRGDCFAGVLFAAVSIIDLSRFAQVLSNDVGQTVFVLHGRSRVIAHPNLPRIGFNHSLETPLPGLNEVADVELTNIWDPNGRPLIARRHMQESQGHYMNRGLGWQVYVYREISDYGPMPWLLGTHYISNGDEVMRFWWMTGIGLTLLLVFTGVALLVGARMARPIRQLAQRAAKVESLDFTQVEPLPPSPVLELNQAAGAFNAMTGTLRSLETYVPKRLVRRLLAAGGSDAALTAEREVTVLFTDIVGFSALVEGLTARQTAELLNRHFQLLNKCIEETGGTLDKYTGDGVMAFWGAPDAQPDHAQRACEAANAIAKAITLDNDQRRARGQAPICIRIGLHTGPAIVGNIGAEGRVDYTVVGDTVNVASRLERAAGNLPLEDTVAILSGETRTAAGADTTCDFVGRRRVKGRRRPVDIFRLR